MATANITKSLLDGIERPESGTTRIMDAKLQGFGVDVGKRRVTFFARRWSDGKTHKEKVGEWPAVTVQEARENTRQFRRLHLASLKQRRPSKGMPLRQETIPSSSPYF